MNNNKATAADDRRRIAAAAVILAAFAVPGVTLGQQPESLIVDVGACVNLQSPGERLDCYEEQVQRARAEAPVAPVPPAALPPAATPPAGASSAVTPPAPAPQVATSAPAVVTPAPAAPTASTGGRAERRVRVENARVASGGSSAEPDSFEGVITALRESVPNAWVVTLDNGQVWRQDYPERYRLRVGQPVRIARARGFGGGFRLTVAELGGSIQVERVR